MEDNAGTRRNEPKKTQPKDMANEVRRESSLVDEDEVAFSATRRCARENAVKKGNMQNL